MSMPAEVVSSGTSLDALLPDVTGLSDTVVTGLASDSRRVEPGYLFLATRGSTSHGMAFADQALERGAAAIIFDPEGAPSAPPEAPVPVVAVHGLGARVGELAHRFYGAPSEAVDVYAVTGTNGKTTVAWLLSQCQAVLGTRSAYIGTLGTGIGRLDTGPGLTTPGAVELHGRLAEFRDAGATAAAVEVSSHALDQGRVDGVRIRSALFTNLSRDHLDYHGSMRAYFEAKARLFVDCRPAQRIIDVDTEYGAELASRCGDDVVVVSTRRDSVVGDRPYVFVQSMAATGSGSALEVESSWGRAEFELPLLGHFNVANAALVMAALLAGGAAMDEVVTALSSVRPPPGRLETVPGPGPQVFVDFAHTPEALEVVLGALRPHVRGRLTVVFGAGGNRDAGKRPSMGRVAERLADAVVLTSDNPRSEDPLAIIEAIRGGMADGRKATVIEDRAAAIGWAIAGADSRDTVLIAGKGHERFQEVGAERRPFADSAVAALCLRKAAGGRR